MLSEELEIVIHAAYRVGLLDIMLSEDVGEAMPMPGFIRQSFEGELEMRLRQVEAGGMNMDEFNEWRIDPRKETK